VHVFFTSKPNAGTVYVDPIVGVTTDPSASPIEIYVLHKFDTSPSESLPCTTVNVAVAG